MGKRNSEPQRVDNNFLKDMRESALMRIKNDLARPVPKETSVKEMTRLLTKTDGYRISLQELKTKPRRR